MNNSQYYSRRAGVNKARGTAAAPPQHKTSSRPYPFPTPTYITMHLQNTHFLYVLLLLSTLALTSSARYLPTTNRQACSPPSTTPSLFDSAVWNCNSKYVASFCRVLKREAKGAHVGRLRGRRKGVAGTSLGTRMGMRVGAVLVLVELVVVVVVVGM